MYRFRLRVLLILAFGGCLMVTTRLFYLQVVQREHWQEYAESIRLSKRSTPTHRGRILAVDTAYNSDGAGPEVVVLAADRPAFDIAMRLSDLDTAKPTFRRALYKELRVDGLRVRERSKVKLVLAQTGQGGWAARMSYSGVILRRKQPSRIIRLIWKGQYVREGVEEDRTIPIPNVVLQPVLSFSELTGTDFEELLGHVIKRAEEMLNDRINSWEARPVLKNVPYETVMKVEVHHEKLRGFFAEPKRTRRYPQGELAGHVVGYMAKLNTDEYAKYRKKYAGSWEKRYFLNDTIGRSGVEARFNPSLRGARGAEVVEKDRHGRVVQVLKRFDSGAGSDVYLTILPTQQRAAEAALGDRTGAAVVIDARNGEILVLASAPRFNPATFSRDYAQLVADPRKPLVHKAVKSYPLGSTFKIVTSLAAWDAGVDPGIEFECRGRYNVGTRGVRCAARWGHGKIPYRTGMKKSCNVHFCELGAKAGSEKLAEWALKLGLGQNTAFELGGEHVGYVPSPARRQWEQGRGWWSGDTANYSIGQGSLLVTPLQAARAMAVVCSGGRLVMPHIVKKIVNANGREIPVPNRGSIEPVQVALPAGAAERIRDALTAVAHEQGGTAHRAFVGWDKPYRIAGKTSTAERPGRSDLGWFVGVAPADNPRLAFAVAVDLNEGEHGGDVPAPIARQILESFPDEFITGQTRALVSAQEAADAAQQADTQ